MLTGVGQIIATASGTTTDLASLYQSLLDIQALMGDAALNASKLSSDAINGAGGISQLNAGLTAYSTKYFTVAQQLAAQTADMTDKFAALGDVLPATRADFVALMDAANAAGNETMIGKLAALAAGFDTLQTSMGNASTVISAADVAIQSATAAFQVLSTAVAAAQTALTAQHTANLAAITSNGVTQLAALQATEGARTIAMMVYQGQLAASLTVANQAVTDINSSINTFTTILGSLNAAITATSVTSQADARNQAMSTLRGASTSSDISSVPGLTDAITAIQGQSDNLYATKTDYQKSQAEANNYLTLINANGTTQLTAAQTQLVALQAVVTAIQAQQTAIANAISGMSAADTATVAAQTKTLTDAENASYTAQQASLAAILSTAQDQLNAINGVNASVVSLANAMGGSSSAISGASATKGVTTTGAPAAFTGLSSTASQAMNAESSGSLDSWSGSVIQALNSGWNGIASFDVGTNSVPNDMLAKVHKGERIIPAADNAALMNKLNGPAANDASVVSSNNAVAAKIDDLIQVIQIGDTANVKSTDIMNRIVRRWENCGMPPTRAAV